VIAVLGSELDRAACKLVEAWSAVGGVLLSARDLCRRGWVFRVPNDRKGSFVAGAVARPIEALRGVVVRRPAVAAEELAWIAQEDRQYVAAEINAFLVAWLAALRCPVLNRPTATSLSGPAWSQIQWRVAAARADVPWADPIEADTVAEVVFCGDLHCGAPSKRQVSYGTRLCAASGADLLGVQFSGDAVAAVTPQPRLADQGARDMVLAYLEHRAAA